MKEKTNTKKGRILSQSEMKDLILPELKRAGSQYVKKVTVMARKAKFGEIITTVTLDGPETTNTAKEADYVIKNQTKAGERYIINGEVFHKKYRLLHKKRGIYNEYQPTRSIFAIQLTPARLKILGFPKESYFVAAWGKKMVMKENDFIVCPDDYSEIYRIAQKEFHETYKLNQ